MSNRVLIVEDYDRDLARYRRHFEDQASDFELFTATTLADAERQFARIRPDIVIVDGCVDGGELDTLPFIRAVRASGFTGMLIAASGLPRLRERMVEAGCTHKAAKEKVVQLIVDNLKSS